MHVYNMCNNFTCIFQWMKMKIDSFNAKDQRRGIKKRRVEVCIFLLWLNFVFVIGCAGDVF